jgi:hypothetical protein
LVDVTCSGATTVHLLQGGQFGQPAQLDAVTPATQLVTVTIGGNDVFFMTNLIAMSCGLPGGCPIRPDALVQTRFASLADSLRQIVAGAHQLADITRQVAQESQADLLDVASLSRTHNACASDPWVLGAHPEAGVAIPLFHPNREALRAVGEALAKMF